MWHSDSVHRGQLAAAAKQLKEASDKTLALMPLVTAHPTLRPGAFT